MLFSETPGRTKSHSGWGVLSKGSRSWGATQSDKRPCQRDSQSAGGITATIHAGENHVLFKEAAQLFVSHILHHRSCSCSWMRGWLWSERAWTACAVAYRPPHPFKASHRGSKSSCRTTNTPCLSCPNYSWASAVLRLRQMSCWQTHRLPVMHPLAQVISRLFRNDFTCA